MSCRHRPGMDDGENCKFCHPTKAIVHVPPAPNAELLAIREAIPMDFLKGRTTLEAVRELTAAGRRVAEKAVYSAKQSDTLESHVNTLITALTEAWEWIDRAAPLYEFQKPGTEFFPNREAIEGCSARIKAALDAVGKK